MKFLNAYLLLVKRIFSFHGDTKIEGTIECYTGRIKQHIMVQSLKAMTKNALNGEANCEYIITDSPFYPPV